MGRQPTNWRPSAADYRSLAVEARLAAADRRTTRPPREAEHLQRLAELCDDAAEEAAAAEAEERLLAQASAAIERALELDDRAAGECCLIGARQGYRVTMSEDPNDRVANDAAMAEADELLERSRTLRDEAMRLQARAIAIIADAQGLRDRREEMRRRRAEGDGHTDGAT